MILAFCRGKGFLSAFIRWQTWSRYSHVAIVTPDGVYEAWPFSGVRVRPYWTDTSGIDFFVCAAPTELATKFLEKQLGKKYDYFGVLRFITRKRKSSARWFCSELAFAAARAAGTELLRNVDCSQVSPGMLSMSPYLNRVP